LLSFTGMFVKLFFDLLVFWVCHDCFLLLDVS
jgi:hypothetical protein